MAETLEAIAKIETEIKAIESRLAEKLTKQDEEIKTIGGTREQTSKEIKGFEEKWQKAFEELKGLVMEEAKKFQERTDNMEAQLKRAGTGVIGGNPEDREKTAGEKFTESAEYKGFNPLTGRTTNKVIVGALYAEKKDITGGAVLRDVLSRTTLQNIVYDPLFRSDHVRDFMNVVTTENEAIHYARETVVDNQAGPQVGGEGGLKPLSGITFVEKVMNMVLIAHGMVVTRQLVADIRALINHINMRLMDGLKHVEDADIVFGDGEDGKMLGIWNSGIQTYNRAVDGDTMIDTLRRAITQIRQNYYTPDLTVLSLEDWEAIELLKDNEGRYIWVQVTEGGVPRLWRVPVIDTTVMPEGSFLQGAFRQGATLWDREEASVRIFDQHADFALRNMLLLLAEERLGLTVERPLAFVKGSFSGS